jgi:hypothetical protein
LTKDDAWINRPELLDRFSEIADSLPDDALRAQLNQYLLRVLPDDPRASREDIHEAVSRVIAQFPEVLDFYVKDKEESGERATSVAKVRVTEAEVRFVEQVRWLAVRLLEPSGFYSVPGNTYQEARERLMFLKDVIENKGGHRIFYLDGRPLERESDLQILYRLT